MNTKTYNLAICSRKVERLELEILELKKQIEDDALLISVQNGVIRLLDDKRKIAMEIVKGYQTNRVGYYA